MGTILASAIVTSMRFTLLDPSPGRTFTDARLFGFIQEALRRMGCVRPDIYTVRGAVPLVAGVHQQLPAGGTKVLSFSHNTASTRGVAQVSESLLLEEIRTLGYGTQDGVVDCYSLDERDETRFTVMPPNDGTGSLSGLYCAVPTIASLSTAIPVDDTYEGAIKFMALAEAYAADSERKDLVKSDRYEQKAMQLLGLDGQAKEALHSKLGKPGGQ